MKKTKLIDFIKKYSIKIIIFLFIVGAFLRFYNLNWGSPFYFHPDERNIASSVVQLNFLNQLNPHFFAYGSFPIYLIYFTNLFLKNTLNFQISFENAILISRFYSALFSLLLIPSGYFICKKFFGKNTAIIFSFLIFSSTGLLQFSHFGTFETWLTLGSLWLFYFSLKISDSASFKNCFFAGIIIGILISIKITTVILWPLPLFALLLFYLSKNKKTNISLLTAKACLLIFFPFLCFVIFSPFSLIDTSSFLSSIRYESTVALGILPVFYTESFLGTTPVLFQFIKIYPFIINPLNCFLFLISIFFLIVTFIKSKGKEILIIILFFLFLFISQAFLFVKWTRYLIPTLPFIYLIIALFLEKSLSLLKNRFIKIFLIFFIIIINLIFLFSYFVTVFFKDDSRILASFWAKNNLKEDGMILSETYDLGITPFNQYFRSIQIFNFYDLDSGNTNLPNVKNYDYIVLPSNRLLKTRLLKPKLFPKGNLFYKNLYEEIDFKKIYQTPCDLFCKITYFNNQIFFLEETTNVFDHPTVFIYEKRN